MTEKKTFNKNGLTAPQVEESRRVHGDNVLTPPTGVRWWELLIEKFKDPIILILMLAAIVSIVVGVIEGNLVEPIGILVAIGLAVGVGFWMEWSANRKFEELNREASVSEVKVIRGQAMMIPSTELVVGDVVLLSAGDEVPADIDLWETTSMKIEESAMTGESVPAGKTARTPEDADWTGPGFAPWAALRGTRVMEGSGIGVVVAVGDNTEIGRTTRSATEDPGLETPLQGQLNRLAALINRVAFGLASTLFVLLNLHHFIAGTPDLSLYGIFTTELRFMMMAVVLVVVAVPEGLPLSTTLALAFSMKTMVKENNLVKKMHACETIGAVDVVFTDKTGTLTQNRMSVVDLYCPDPDRKGDLMMGAVINSSSDLDRFDETIGNPTEGALLRWAASGGLDWRTLRDETKVKERVPFCSENKYMMTITQDGVAYVKGAPEVVAKLTGTEVPEEVVENSKKGRRAISLSQGTSLDDQSYVGTFFIEDPVRPDVPGAVSEALGAGIQVVMMTGDNILTGSSIGQDSGLDVTGAIEAHEFDPDCLWSGKYPKVIARCKPDDKLRILKSFQESGHVCAMTGDGVNDSPSLNHADVGVAMGSGTSVAKEAADIVLLDDAFPSIVTGIVWGRSLYKNIQKFLTFQLSINLAFCLVALAAPLLGQDLPFSIPMILWINIILDAVAAICLASEPADREVLKETPRNREDFIVSPRMYRTILLTGLFLFGITSALIWDMGHQDFLKPIQTDSTIVFAVFLCVCWWNLFNIRVFGKNHGLLYRIRESRMFLIGASAALVGTFLIVQFGGGVFETRPLGLTEWLGVLGFTSSVLLFRRVLS